MGKKKKKAAEEEAKQPKKKKKKTEKDDDDKPKMVEWMGERAHGVPMLLSQASHFVLGRLRLGARRTKE